MDRRLLITSLFLLSLLSLWLLGELGLIPNYKSLNGSHSNDQTQIGEILWMSETSEVRQKHRHQLVWGPGEITAPLYHLDSILTLENSRAKLKLFGDTEIELSERTLVVIEKPPEKNLDTAIRLRFAKGALTTRHSTRALNIAGENFLLKAKAHSNIEIKSAADGAFEISVQSGEAQLEVTDSSVAGTDGDDGRATDGTGSYVGNNGRKQKILPGAMVKLQKGQISQFEVGTSLKFNGPSHNRIYRQNFPTELVMTWSGEAKSLEGYSLAGQKIQQTIEDEQKNIALPLQVGSYFFRLRNKDLVSEEIKVEVLPAPLLKFVSPLPRDRLSTRVAHTFIWQADPKVFKSFKVIIKDAEASISSGQSSPVLESFETNKSFLRSKISAEVQHAKWQVSGTDHDGFFIDAFGSSDFYMSENLLEAPVLKQPKIFRPSKEQLGEPAKKQLRLPASPDGRKKTDSSWWPQLKFDFGIFSQAKAQAKAQVHSPARALAQLSRDENGREKRGEKATEIKVLFEWEPVSGATHYQVEIATDALFESIIETKTINDTKFIWSTTLSCQIHWRVAAQNSDKMLGHFSAPALIDLNTLIESIAQTEKTNVSPSEKPAETLATSPKLAREKIKRPPPFDYSNIAIPGVLIPIWPEDGISEEGSAANGEQTGDSDRPANSKWGLSLSYRPSYSFNQWTTDLNGRAQLNGFQLNNFLFAAKIAEFKTFRFQLAYERNSENWFETSSIGKETDQKFSAIDQKYSLNALSSRSPIGFSIFARSTFYLERLGSQRLQPKSVEIFGVGIYWQLPVLNLNSQLEYGVLSHGSLINFNLSTKQLLVTTDHLDFSFVPKLSYEWLQYEKTVNNKSLRLFLGLQIDF